jgi:DNA-binding NtrC family response regulator
VGELPLSQQVKLLTVLEEKQVRPVGGSRPRGVDVRIVAATCRELATEILTGTFRGDLYHRIALLRCELPPLRSRLDDLEPLANHLLTGLARKYRRPGLTLSEPARAALFEHSWPGNVRELAHALEAATILEPTQTIGADDLRGLIGLRGADPAAPAPRRTGPRQGQRYSFFGSLEEERCVIHDVLGRCRGNRTRAARELGMSRNTLRAKLKRLGLETVLPR